MRLIERDATLRTLASLWVDARAGHGRVIFLGGEAGAGKTSVAQELCRRLAGSTRILTGFCDGNTTPRPLGPLADVAADAGINDLKAFHDVRSALGRVPTILVLEDLHWADEATLDLVRYLARRMVDLPLLVLATFRDDEVTAAHPLASLMGDLATVATTTRMHLPLFTLEAVAELAAGTDQDAEALHRSTSGNPFFVTEVLAAGTSELPMTVRDAVVARAARLSSPARRVLDAAAVCGAVTEISLLTAILDDTEPAFLDECVARGVLLDRGPSIAFRHELARQAILDALPPTTRVALHRKALMRLVAAGSRDHHRLAHHAVACGDAAAVIIHSPHAADRAARLGCHREAAQHLRTALQHGDLLPAPRRAELLERLSYECYLTSRHLEALDAGLGAVALREAAGDWRRVGMGQRWLSRLSWYLSRPVEASRYATAAVATLEPLGPGAALGMAYSNISHLETIGGSIDLALEWGRRALAVARSVGDREVEAHALNNLGTALLRRGEIADGRTYLHQSLDIALANGLEEQAARAWCNLGSLLTANQLFAEASEALQAGITYAVEHDLDACGLYMRALLAGLLVDQGSHAAASDVAELVLRHPHLAPMTRIAALVPAGLAAVRQGDPAAAALVEELESLAGGTSEPQRRLPGALARAEASWTSGKTENIRALTDDVWNTCSAEGEIWDVAELAWWRSLGGSWEPLPELPRPFELMRAGRLREAADEWTLLGRPFWAALCLAGGEPADAAKGVAMLLRLGASASAQAVRRDLAARGQRVPRGPRDAARRNAAGLTARELDVLSCLVEGLSDADIASRLTVSGRTVGHHVSAVLRKLDVSSRSRAAYVGVDLLGAPTPT